MICPTCQRELDAIRAPVARIVGGKVTTFCSPECSRGEPRKTNEPPSSAFLRIHRPTEDPLICSHPIRH